EDVGRQQVARELHALERKPDGARERMSERCLAHPRDVFDQKMAAREQTGNCKADLQFLTEDNAADLLDDFIDAHAHLQPRSVPHAALRIPYKAGPLAVTYVTLPAVTALANYGAELESTHCTARCNADVIKNECVMSSIKHIALSS